MLRYPLFSFVLLLLSVGTLSASTTLNPAITSRLLAYTKFSQSGLSNCSTNLFKQLFSSKYEIEEHTVNTTDGYILTLFRVNLTAAEKAKLPDAYKKNIKKVIHLQHGLEGSADDWFYNKDKSAGLYVLDRGYDVWVGNNRGNKYCRSHTNSNMSDKDFFDFSFDEMALYDLPAFYNYVLAATGVEKLTWIGHSMGTSQFFAAALDPTTRDLVNAHTEKFIALAPIVYMNHGGSTAIKFLAPIADVIKFAGDNFGLYDFGPSPCLNEPNWAKVVTWMCKTLSILCDNIIPGINIDQTVDNALDNASDLITHYPAGTSLKSLVKYAQAIEMSTPQKFVKYDYGFFGNISKYGSYKVPEWDMKLFKVDTALVGATRDEFGSETDVANLSSDLPIASTRSYVMPNWDHVTFLFARDPSPLFAVLEKELP
jgi:pimeloyl-ACP methyl ester carboxylesterase